MEYSSLVLHATEIATFFLSPKQGDEQILFLVEGQNLCSGHQEDMPFGLTTFKVNLLEVESW